MAKNSLPDRAKLEDIFIFFSVNSSRARVRSRARGETPMKWGFLGRSLDKSQTTFNKHPKKEVRKSEEKVRTTFNG